MNYLNDNDKLFEAHDVLCSIVEPHIREIINDISFMFPDRRGVGERYARFVRDGFKSIIECAAKYDAEKSAFVRAVKINSKRYQTEAQL